MDTFDRLCLAIAILGLLIMSGSACISVHRAHNNITFLKEQNVLLAESVDRMATHINNRSKHFILVEKAECYGK